MSEVQSVQWFPGHMAKTRRAIQSSLKLVDIVAELIDARIPISSRNPVLKSIIGSKPKIVLMNKGYSLYGIKVGDKISNALKVLKKKNLVLESDQADRYTYRIPALADALSVDEEGFCGYLVVVVADDDTIQAICLYSDTVEQRFTGY